MLKKELIVSDNITLKEALKLLDKGAHKIVFVVDKEEILVGCLSDGDARRAILNGISLDTNLRFILNPSPKKLIEKCYSDDEINENFIKNRIDVIPIVNKYNKIIDIICAYDLLATSKKEEVREQISYNVPVIVMTGGKGTRLAPFTYILPKALVPIGETPILTHILTEFSKYGMNDFYFMLNHKAEMIEAYYKGSIMSQNIFFIREPEFLGTAGCLPLVKKNIFSTFIVCNCDVIVKANYADVIKFHKDNKAKLTVLSAIQHHQIPYGVIDFREGGEVTKIIEKPEYTHVINTGVYILEPEVLNLIPGNTPYGMPDVIAKLIKTGEKVMTYPVNEGDYIDIGQWDEYQRAVDKMTNFTKTARL